MIDPQNSKGNRFMVIDGIKKLNGYEIHFLPSQGSEVFIDDSLIPEYAMTLSQDSLYAAMWKGEIVSLKLLMALSWSLDLKFLVLK